MAKTEGRKNKRKRWRLRKSAAPVGSPPGTLQVDPQALQTTIRVIRINETLCTTRNDISIEQLREVLNTSDPMWIDVTGLGTIETLRAIAELVKIHPLAMEDVLNVHQRAKVDQYGDSLFIVARAVDSNDATDSEQLAFVMRPNILVSFQQRPGDNWDSIRNRLREGRSAMRKNNVDYLLYCLLDSVIDSYFPFLDQLAEQLDHIDESITDGNNSREAFSKLHQMRGQLLALRRIVRPHRDMVNQLIRDEYPLIMPETRIFLRDCYDHIIHVNDAAETYNELANGIREYYM